MKVVHIMMKSLSKFEDYKINLKRLKSVVDPRYLVESLGFQIERETSREIRGECKIHGGDNKTAFRFNKETKTWVCFTRRCHEIYGYDVIGLIQASLGLDFNSAVKYLQDLVGDVENLSLKALQYEIKREKEEFINRYKKKGVSDSIVTEEALMQFKPFRSNHFLEDGFSNETLDYFEVAGGFTDGYGYIRDIIPIRDENDVLVGYHLRDIRTDATDDYKYIHSRGFDKEHVLYNLNKAKEYGKNMPLIVVEGEKSVWRCYDYGIYNVVSCMGSSITEGQRNLLCSYALNGVIIMLDSDEAGVIGMVNACVGLKTKVDVMPIYITEVGKDGKGFGPADLSKKVMYNYIGLKSEV
jgi:DNA primase